MLGLTEAENDGLRLTLRLGEYEGLSDGDSETDKLADRLGLRDRLRLALIDGDSEALGDSEGETLMLRLGEADGE